MNQDHISHLIQRYLKGTLSDTEKGDLEHRLSQDAGLSEEVELQRLEKQVADELIARNLREKMRKFDQQEPPVSGRRFFKGFKLLILTGLAIVTIVVSWWLAGSNNKPSEQHDWPQDLDMLQQPNSPFDPEPGGSKPLPKSGIDIVRLLDTPNVLAKEKTTLPPSKSEKQAIAEELEAYRQIAVAYFEPMNRLAESSMGEERIEKPGNSVLDADQYYQKGELYKAIAIMQNLADEKPDASRLHLILGKLYFEAGDFAKAIAILQPVSERNSLYASEARWNLLLSYLVRYESHQKDYKMLLSKIIADPRHFRHDSAIALSEKLKR
ncbi:MAG: tetratricopeptide repeat protein [Saprospiraceae bacterium]